MRISNLLSGKDSALRLWTWREFYVIMMTRFASLLLHDFRMKILVHLIKLHKSYADPNNAVIFPCAVEGQREGISIGNST